MKPEPWRCELMEERMVSLPVWTIDRPYPDTASAPNDPDQVWTADAGDIAREHGRCHRGSTPCSHRAIVLATSTIRGPGTTKASS